MEYKINNITIRISIKNLNLMAMHYLTYLHLCSTSEAIFPYFLPTSVYLYVKIPPFNATLPISAS